MVDHDRALAAAEHVLMGLVIALEADTCTHESEWPGDPEEIGPARREKIARVRRELSRVANQIDTIDHYNQW